LRLAGAKGAVHFAAIDASGGEFRGVEEFAPPQSSLSEIESQETAFDGGKTRNWTPGWRSGQVRRVLGRGLKRADTDRTSRDLLTGMEGEGPVVG
jgi:hypothetical protein